MSVRAGMLVLLGEAAAYGLQLHGELEQRTDRVGRINVGQIYSTLERLSTAGLVTASGTTDDGLPLYMLTEAGHDEAEAWLEQIDIDSPTAWPDMLFKVLLVTSIDHRTAQKVIGAYRATWSTGDDTGTVSPDESHPAALLARRRIAHAARTWLDDLVALPGGLPALQRPLRNERPRRGRRPAPTPE